MDRFNDPAFRYYNQNEPQEKPERQYCTVAGCTEPAAYRVPGIGKVCTECKDEAIAVHQIDEEEVTRLYGR